MCQNYYKTLHGNITNLSILIYRDNKYSVNAWITKICCKRYCHLFDSVHTTFHTTQVIQVLVKSCTQTKYLPDKRQVPPDD